MNFKPAVLPIRWNCVTRLPIGYLFAPRKAMNKPELEARATLNQHHVADKESSASEFVAAVCETVKQMPGFPGCVLVYPAGRAKAPDAPEWLELVRWIEAVATAALMRVGARIDHRLCP
jgi:hypothetical protein